MFAKTLLATRGVEAVCGSSGCSGIRARSAGRYIYLPAQDSRLGITTSKTSGYIYLVSEPACVSFATEGAIRYIYLAVLHSD